MNYAVILAGGKGLRIGGKTPKQFIDLNGEPMIVRTIRAFNDVDEIDGICVVCLIDYLSLLNDLVKKYNLNKVKFVCFGEQLDDIEEFDLDNYLYGLTKGMEVN